jgi:mono/diheme cytochrome c family protein
MPDQPADNGRTRLALLVFVAVLVAVGSWFLYREFGAPSFRSYERRFRSSYSGYLRQEIARRSADEQKVLATPDYQKLDASLKGQPDKDAEAKRDQFIKSKLPGQTASELRGLLQKVQNMETKPREWSLKPAGGGVGYVAGPGLVDRCQSCHLSDDPTLVPAGMTLTKAALGMDGSKDAPFASHPEPELLAIHPPEKFGCSSCHGGNGSATESVTMAHGQDGKWPIPLYAPENYEAGCQRCHASDMITEYAPVLSRGKELFRRNGCTACHVYQGFDRENEAGEVRQLVAQLQNDRRAKLVQIAQLNKAGDTAKDNAAASRDYQQAANLTMAVSNIDAQTGDLQRRTSQARQVPDKIGPDLSEARVKLVKEWIPYWLGHTREYRPGTKMPQFPFKPGEAEAIAAFVWQAGVEGSPALPKRAPGDPVRGKELFDSRGCLGCHSIGEDDSKMGGTFAGNLSREGEKANYDWVVRFILEPSLRTRPYCGFEKKGIGPEDYAKKGLPYVFDLDHDRCPNDGRAMVTTRPNVMPSFRLTDQEAQDLASYLMTQKRPDFKYPPAPYMDDAQVANKGKELTIIYGCEACHSGPIGVIGCCTPNTHPIGNELTREGDKPVDQLHFDQMARNAKSGLLPDGKPSPRGPWYSLAGFVNMKLTDPTAYETNGNKPSPADRMHMPRPDLTEPGDADALTTMVIGSAQPPLPEDYIYKPSRDSLAIQDGWWIISKYNCTGCHQIAVGQKTALMDLPMYQGENKAKLPPVLIGEGARVTPEWLAEFLHNPSLSPTETHRNGVRSYLELHMPNFHLTDDQIRKLVLFFQAMVHEGQPYVPQELKPLTPEEKLTARELFTSASAPCLKCHATGDPAHDKIATAPNFLLSKDRLRPDWTQRWITNPQLILPGTSMPAGLFSRDKDRWVFSGPLPASSQAYHGDHADLLVRYMFQITPEEQKSLVARSPVLTSGK